MQVASRLSAPRVPREPRNAEEECRSFRLALRAHLTQPTTRLTHGGGVGVAARSRDRKSE